MKTVRCIYWQDGDVWLGHVEEFPDYVTQGQTLEDLQENLKDLYQQLTAGISPGERLQVIAYDDRIELIPIRPTKQLRGFLEGLDTTVGREDDRV